VQGEEGGGVEALDVVLLCFGALAGFSCGFAFLLCDMRLTGHMQRRPVMFV
jgi:hypothetical protein